MKYLNIKLTFIEVAIYLACFTNLLIDACPTGCACVSTVVNCQYLFLTEIPEDIPSDTVQLFFDGNQISTIQRSKLSHLKSLKTLSFGSNSIVSIADDAFEDLEGLTRLYLNSNKLQRIKRTFFQNLTSLQFLQLSRVSEDASLCIDDFAFEHQGQLQQLYLANNMLLRISNDTLYGLSNLELLDLTNNNIELFSSDSFKHFTSTNPQVSFAEYTPPCCCQSKEAFLRSSTNSLSLKCKNQNASVSEGKITTMPCVKNDEANVCESYRESTCNLWPPIPEELESPSSKVAQATSSVFSQESSEVQQQFSTEYSDVSSSVSNTQASQSSLLSTFSVYSPSSRKESEITLNPTVRQSLPPTSITITSSKSREISQIRSTILYPYSSRTQVYSNEIVFSSSTAVKGESTYITEHLPDTATYSSSVHLLLTTSTVVVLIDASSSISPETCSVKECSAGCTLSITSCKCMNESGTSECPAAGEKQTGVDEGDSLQRWQIALIAGSVGFIVVFVLLFIYFKKRQRRERRKFSIHGISNNGVEMSRNNNNNNNRESDNRMTGRENNAFIIEQSPPRGNRNGEIH